MRGAHDILGALAMVLCVAAATTVLFQRLRQPVVLGYLLAGLIIGPHVPTGLVADPDIVHTLSELGVILLMFSLGLEFSLRRLARVGSSAAIVALVQCSLMLWLGISTGRIFGWTSRESFFAGAIVAISSTTIIAKAFDDEKIGGRLRELVVAVLIVEDLIAILLMAGLTAAGSDAQASASVVLAAAGRLLAFLASLMVVGMLVVPRLVRAVQKLGRPETTVIASIGICFAIALCARELGYSVALGAFLAGSLVAESGEGRAIEQLVQPVRDLFAAVFFVSVGMSIDPELAAAHWSAIAALTAIVIVGKIAGVATGAFLTGSGIRTSVQAGMSLAQIGEFSFILASLGIELGATRTFLYPVAVAVSALTTLSTPWLIRSSGPAAAWIDRKLPSSLQTFAALYGSWLERLRSGSSSRAHAARVRRLVLLAVVDAALLGAIVIGAALSIDDVAAFVEARAGIPAGVARAVVVAATALASLPFCVGIVRVARKLGVQLAEAALPERKGLDLSAAPRRALVVTLQMGCVLLVGAPLVAVTQPFLGGAVGRFAGPALLVLALAILGLAFWRSAANLQAHVRAGAQMIVEVLAAQSRAERSHASAAQDLAPVQSLLDGIGEPVAVTLPAECTAVGKTFAELELRGATGATCLAIVRGEQGVAPSAGERLRAGDVLALAGTHEAIASAREPLLARADPPAGSDAASTASGGA